MGTHTRRFVILGVVSLVVIGTVVGAGAGTAATSPSGATASERPGNEMTSHPIPHRASLVQNRVTSENFTVPARDHGINATVFPRLWSGDADEPGADDSGTLGNLLLTATDYAFGRPPAAVETWNSGDHQEFPETDANSSVYPPHANLTDSLWIEDAYIQVFAVQPSTVAHVSPNDTRHYIRPTGAVLGTTDYRVGLPADETERHDPPAPDPGETVHQKTTVTWEVLEHEMSNVTLEADGDPVATTGPTHTSRLTFESLSSSTDRLTLTITISATVQKTTEKTFKTATEVCDSQTPNGSNQTGNATDCEVVYDTFTTTDRNRSVHSVTVRDTIEVEIYELSPTATRATFVDGGTALAVNQSTGDPWAAYQLPDGRSVHNLWHFYSARNRHWDTLVTSTESETTRGSSDAIPLQVHAFPSDGGAYARAEFDELEVTEVWGLKRRSPTLPPNITFPVVDHPYSGGSVVVVRSDGAVELDGPVAVYGLVSGTQERTSVRMTRHQQASTLDLELLGVNRSKGTATVRVSLREAATGQPIDLRSRPGVVRIHGVEVEPNASGVAIATVPLAGGLVMAEYEPANWWAADPVYTSARASAAPPNDWPEPRRLVSVASTILLWLSPLLFGIYLIDRLLGRGRLWPPWEDVE